MRPSRLLLVAGTVLALAACGSDPPSAGPSSAPSAPPTGSAPSSAATAAPPAGTAAPGAPATPPASPGTASRPAQEAAQAVARCAAEVVDGLTPDQQAGQLLMVGAPADDPARGRRLVADHDPGAVFLYGRSSAPAAEVAAGITRLADAVDTGVALHVAVDQEGGEVRTLKGDGVVQLPSGVVQGGWSPDRLRRETTAAARSLAGIGVTLNLSPVADVVPAGTERRNPPIGAFGRQFGSDPAEVADDVRVVVAASRDAGLLTTVKHFPGLGRVRVNTDKGTGATDDRTDADDAALEPFVAGTAAGAGAVMMSTALYPRLDADNPAAFSRAIVTGLLRDRLGWDGVVVSDDLGSAVAVQDVPVGRRAVRFVEAGGDVVLTNAPDTVPAMARALRERIRDDAGFASAVRVSAERVVASKVALGLVTC